jgi:transcriptional regulator with XRE-family HTH domain
VSGAQRGEGERRSNGRSGPAPAGETAPKAPTAPEPGIGGYLASQRKLRGISLDELASLTKIPRRSLERLESGAFDTHPDGFVRGFVRTVAAALGLDPDESVMRLLPEPDWEADEAPAPSPVAGARLARAAALALAAAALVAAIWLAATWRSVPPEPEAPPVVLRRDPVRELATEAAPGVPEPEAGRP